MNTISQHHRFFTFSRTYNFGTEEQPKIFVSKSGIAWDQIERYFIDTNNTLIVVMKSMTEDYKNIPSSDKKGAPQQRVKVPINVTLLIDNPDDIERFFAAVEDIPLEPKSKDLEVSEDGRVVYKDKPKLEVIKKVEDTDAD